MSSSNLVIVPTRGRGKRIRERVFGNMSLSKDSDFVLAVDDDDPSDYGWAEQIGLRVDRGPGGSMNKALNRVALKFCHHYDFLAFLGDDHRVITPGWDAALCSSLREKKLGVAFGNDLLSNPPLATFVVLDSRIVRRQGFFAPTQLRHMYLDDYWMFLGKQLGTLTYLPDVVVEHEHFSSGKTQHDSTYAATNKLTVNYRDRLNFHLYRHFLAKRDFAKLLSVAS